MQKFKVGVMVECFNAGFLGGLEKAKALGADGVQIYTTGGEMATENLSPAKRKELFDAIKSNGLVVSALCGDFGRGFTKPDQNPELIERSKRVIDLALEWETNVVTTHIGVVPADKNSETYKIMQQACGELAAYASSQNAFFAVETGPETALCLKEFLDSLGSKGVSVNLDPANLTMVMGDDPVAAVYTLKDYIVHTHAKDGINLKKAPDYLPKELADRTHECKKQLGEDEQNLTWIEVALGKGQVKWDDYLKALDDIGFKGFLTIERECGDDPAADIFMAAEFLRDMMKKM